MAAGGELGMTLVAVVLMLVKAVLVMLMMSTGTVVDLSMRDAPVAAFLAMSASIANCSAELVVAASGAPSTAALAGNGAVEPAVGFCLTVPARLSDASLQLRS